MNARKADLESPGQETAEILDGIHSQLELLNETLEDLQTDIQWALRNVVHHLTSTQANSVASMPPVQDSAEQQASVMLRDLLSAPELNEGEVSDSTRKLLQAIIDRLQSNRPALAVARPPVSKPETSSDTKTKERQEGHLF